MIRLAQIHNSKELIFFKRADSAINPHSVDSVHPHSFVHPQEIYPQEFDANGLIRNLHAPEIKMLITDMGHAEDDKARFEAEVLDTALGFLRNAAAPDEFQNPSHDKSTANLWMDVAFNNYFDNIRAT